MERALQIVSLSCTGFASLLSCLSGCAVAAYIILHGNLAATGSLCAQALYQRLVSGRGSTHCGVGCWVSGSKRLIGAGPGAGPHRRVCLRVPLHPGLQPRLGGLPQPDGPLLRVVGGLCSATYFSSTGVLIGLCRAFGELPTEHSELWLFGTTSVVVWHALVSSYIHSWVVRRQNPSKLLKGFHLWATAAVVSCVLLSAFAAELEPSAKFPGGVMVPHTSLHVLTVASWVLMAGAWSLRLL
jgi:hypothetical protein